MYNLDGSIWCYGNDPDRRNYQEVVAVILVVVVVVGVVTVRVVVVAVAIVVEVVVVLVGAVVTVLIVLVVVLSRHFCFPFSNVSTHNCYTKAVGVEFGSMF